MSEVMETCVCVYVCVCDWDREREKEREYGCVVLGHYWTQEISRFWKIL